MPRVYEKRHDQAIQQAAGTHCQWFMCMVRTTGRREAVSSVPRDGKKIQKRIQSEVRVMSYVEYLLSYLLLACGLVGSAMFLIGWLIAYLIEHKGDIK